MDESPPYPEIGRIKHHYRTFLVLLNLPQAVRLRTLEQPGIRIISEVLEVQVSCPTSY